MAEMVVTTPEGTVFRYRLGRVTVIGRHPDCEIVLTDPMSSRRHCKVEQAAGGYAAEDNGSANGTLLNGEALRSRKPFKNGDTIQIGSTLLTLRVDAPPPVRGKPVPMASSPEVSLVFSKEDLSENEPTFEATLDASKAVSAGVETADVEQLKRVTQRLKLMVDMGQALSSMLNPRKVLQTCVDKLFEVFPYAERGFVLLYGPDGQIPSTIQDDMAGGDELEARKNAISVSKVRNPETGQENQVMVSRTVVSRVRSQRQAVLLSDNAGDAGFSPGMSMMRLEIRSVMCTPLLAGNEDLGILYLDTKDSAHRFSLDDLNLLSAVAGQAAVVIKNAELARQAASEAATRQNLQRFLSPQLVDQIIKKELTVELGGSMKHGTVFFSDIVGFTRMAAQMRPSDVVALLNRYFTVMQEIIFSKGGTVDKTGGDAIMAFWGVLVEAANATASAATAAIEMQNAMFVFNRDLAADETIVKPPEPLGHGLGLNTGDFVAGNIGSERKIEFTVIGNAVNLAQRVESIAGRGQVFLGQGTYEEIKERAFVFRMPDCPVKNVDKPIQVYSLRGIVPPAPKSKRPGGEPAGQTSRHESSSEELLLSLPCVLSVEGLPPVPAVVTRMAIEKATRQARIQCMVERPVAQGAHVQLLWNLPEKANLEAVDCEVEHSWTPAPQAAAQALNTPTDKPGPAPKIQPDAGTALIDVSAVEGTLTLRAKKVSEDLLGFHSGSCVPSDLKSHDQIVRA